MAWLNRTREVREWLATYGDTLHDVPTWRHQLEVVQGDIRRAEPDCADFKEAGLHDEAHSLSVEINDARVLAERLQTRLNHLTRVERHTRHDV